MYRLYVKTLQGIWEKMANKNTLEEINKIANRLNDEDYYSYMIVESTKEGDSLVMEQDLYKRNINDYKKCRVEFVDNLKTDVEVKAVVFKPSRMKKKEELRKMTEEFIDR